MIGLLQVRIGLLQVRVRVRVRVRATNQFYFGSFLDENFRGAEI